MAIRTLGSMASCYLARLGLTEVPTLCRPPQLLIKEPHLAAPETDIDGTSVHVLTVMDYSVFHKHRCSGTCQ
ncbi:uncharacterized protein F5147DRAFT_700178 [Suillus discolor]|uniref:Uncharacterized protein n=1 Tax=Suillus discolor TaxID=1912936 RepID=A0A9P7F5J8_9AGAM|nr:uncharacterized protein F5147DRAFT_700178 [Suillus discolor]KAG2106813.1 hypothetical protein F5147DRAFT_700178 [Suillus discolor]